jgi:hypothetical protein
MSNGWVESGSPDLWVYVNWNSGLGLVIVCCDNGSIVYNSFQEYSFFFLQKQISKNYNAKILRIHD